MGTGMNETHDNGWEDRVVSPENALSRIEPGMRIFLGTGAAEPRTLVHHLIKSNQGNLLDLELIQLVSFGKAISSESRNSRKFRFKTFFSGWLAGEAVASGQVDLIPCRFSSIPRRIQNGQIQLDVAFVQISPPDKNGWCSLGLAVDAARQAMDKASLTIGEINAAVPRTTGDTHVRLSDFGLLVNATEPPIYFDRWPVNTVYDQLALHVASVIADGSCISFSFGPLFDALTRHLASKRDLGIHSPFFTDALMDLVKSGAVTNRYKKTFPGKSVASYAIGTPALMAWLDDNPMVEFHGIDQVFNPLRIGLNPNFVSIQRAAKVDLTGHIILPTGTGLAAAGPEEAVDFINGAELSPDGTTVIALPSRNRLGQANILPTLNRFHNRLSFRESVDMVVTEYGPADLGGKTLRERAQALIDIAHPDDRKNLVDRAKGMGILYPDQMFFEHCAAGDPDAVDVEKTLKNGTVVRFRSIKPSDEENMRRLFYRFSDETVYYRYFSPVKAMPHSQMQEYVNIDCSTVLSIVAVTGPPGQRRIIAEARSIRDLLAPEADTAFVVEEAYQRQGIASFLFRLLIDHARQRGVHVLKADVLPDNRSMMMVFEKTGLPISAELANGVYTFRMRITPDHET